MLQEASHTQYNTSWCVLRCVQLARAPNGPPKPSQVTGEGGVRRLSTTVRGLSGAVFLGGAIQTVSSRLVRAQLESVFCLDHRSPETSQVSSEAGRLEEGLKGIEMPRNYVLASSREARNGVPILEETGAQNIHSL